MKLWGGRFTQDTHVLVELYNASIHFDKKLARYDLLGSIAHVRMLGKCKLLQPNEAQTLEKGLKNLHQQLQQEELQYSTADEDIHMNLERLLHEQCGEVAGKLHSGRSRNDQVALDLHLYLRSHLTSIMAGLHALTEVLANIASQHVDTLLPGYTHLQRAEPVRLAHHMLAYCQMFYRDLQRLQDSFARVNTCPLGAGALAGSGLAIDRQYTADLLGFDTLYDNSMDAVSDRDFIVEFLADAAMVMMHISRLGEELIIWSSQEFAFVELSDAFTTGSSMMPQKKNPDVCELARGKTGRVYGALQSMLTVMKSLPLSYNKDLQEDKEGLFDTVDTLEMTLAVFAPMLQEMGVNKKNMYRAVSEDFSNATQLANYLVGKNVPFRQAHAISGQLVQHCLREGCYLAQLPLDFYQSRHAAFAEDIFEALQAEAVVESHQAEGGTARESVLQQLQNMQSRLQSTQQWIEQTKARIETVERLILE